ncbi:MAG: hypothetical protein GY811_18625 [Myxococcales bacterium]|nr:hypothetical protein [Myxococcales bacterium]
MTLAVPREFHSDDPTLDAGPDYCSYPQFRLEVVEGHDKGKVLVSTDISASIGGDAFADLTLSDPTVAKFQCEMISRTDRIDIVSLAPDHATSVNEVEVQRAHLRRPATIQVGESKIYFEPMSSSLHVRRSREVSFAHLVGNSGVMRDLFVDLARVASAETPLLLLGGAGSGKESVARAVHRQSSRRAGPFHIVDCTGTHQQVERSLIDAFETAAGGTLYLAQISEMSHELQSRLLRVFLNGGPGAVADLRIVSSSSTDVRKAVNEGAVDSRLHGYLSSAIAHVPPLRQRAADLPPLVKALLIELGVDLESLADGLCTPDFFARLARYSWPGNVRELREHLRHCIQQGKADPVGQSAANANAFQEGRPAPTPSIDISRPVKAGREEWTKYFERLYLADILEAQGGNVTRAAKAAGVDRGHFYRLMMRCGLRN